MITAMNRASVHFEVLVIGGGPAGMAAAARAAECGVRVGIVDDNFRLGGQIWRGQSEDKHDRTSKQNTEASKWAERLRAAGVTSLCGLRVVHQPDRRCFTGRKSRWLLRTHLREACAGNWREGTIPAVSGLDVTQCDGRGRPASDGQVRPADSRQACDRCRHRSLAARRCRLPPQAWR